MNSKGQSISINTIIIAAIALAVLVVLFAIFTGRLGLFSKGVQETTNCEQGCKSAGYNTGFEASSNDGGTTFKDCGSATLLSGYYVNVDNKRKSCCCSGTT